MIEVRIRSKCRGHVFAKFIDTDDGIDQLKLADVAVGALFALGKGLFEPLSVEAVFGCCDAEFGHPLSRDIISAAPFHQLRVASLPEAVQIRGMQLGDPVNTRYITSSAAIDEDGSTSSACALRAIVEHDAGDRVQHSERDDSSTGEAEASSFSPPP